MNVNRDVIERLERLGLRYYVTGSEALGRYAEPRMTRDMDVVIDAHPDDYERLIRPAFEDAYLVADLAVWPGKALGSVLHMVEIAKVDIILGRADPWARSALERRVHLQDPVLGSSWFISPEDLILAKLEWSEGGRSELQIRDCRSLVRLNLDLDWDYLRRYAGVLGVGALLEQIRDD